jgi:quercetin dioxygenase-like cupin family protein
MAHTIEGETVEVLPKQPAVKGPEWLTGEVYFNVIARGDEPSRIRVNTVRFTPCSRTAWHRHAVGQTLHVTEGVGLVQSRGGEIVQMLPGDTVYTPPGEWHWHGATRGGGTLRHAARLPPRGGARGGRRGLKAHQDGANAP